MNFDKVAPIRECLSTDSSHSQVWARDMLHAHEQITSCGLPLQEGLPNSSSERRPPRLRRSGESFCQVTRGCRDCSHGWGLLDDREQKESPVHSHAHHSACRRYAGPSLFGDQPGFASRCGTTQSCRAIDSREHSDLSADAILRCANAMASTTRRSSSSTRLSSSHPKTRWCAIIERKSLSP